MGPASPVLLPPPRPLTRAPLLGQEGSYFTLAPSGGGALLFRARRAAGEHRGGVAVQDLLACFVADIGFLQRLLGPADPELGAVGAAHDALGAVEAHAGLDRARAERVAVHVHLGIAEA